MSEYLVWNRESKSLVVGSPFPSEEAAQNHVNRLLGRQDAQEGPNSVYAVVEVPEDE